MPSLQPHINPAPSFEKNLARLKFGEINGKVSPSIDLQSEVKPAIGYIKDLNTDFKYIEQQVKAATEPMLNSCALEQHHIVRMVERAENRLQVELKLSKDKDFKKNFEESYATYDALMRGDIKSSPRHIQCTDFNRPLRHFLQTVELAVQNKYENTTSEYSAFLKAILLRLQRRQDLRDLFEKLMLSTGGSEVLKRIKCFEAGIEWRYVASIQEAQFELSQSYATTSPSVMLEGTSSPTMKPIALGALARLDLPSFLQESQLSPDYSYREILKNAISRKIPSLMHFTRASNLESILKHGLCSVDKAGGQGIKPHINDSFRLDGHLGAISLSIAFPNHKMFYSYRQKEPDEEWVILIIDPKILGLKHCAFCQRNAADHRIRQLPLPTLMSADAFRGMFEVVNGVPSRQEQQLLVYDPTDPQAEILVFQTIEPEYIGGIAFDSYNVHNAYSHLLGDRKWQVFKKNTGLFGTRGFARNKD